MKDEELLVNTTGGQVKGCLWENGAAFLGVRYGQAERFHGPTPAVWDGVLDCTEYRAKPPQPNYRLRKPEGLEYEMIGDEDCQNLNIWTTDMDPEAKLPVFIYVYGGAFQVGSNSGINSRGPVFMGNEKMVFVSVNYRVGVLGFLELGGVLGDEYAGSGNSAMKDLLLALKFIRENISNFGGDPERLILSGISAGAKAIGCLMTHPYVQESVHQVILESGAMQAFRTVETAQRVAEDYLKLLPEGSDVRTLPAEKLVEVQAEFCSVDGNTCFFGPVLTDPFRPDWMERWEAGERFTGKAVIGTGRHELTFQCLKPYFPEQAEKIAHDMFGENGDLACRMAHERLAAGMSVYEAWEPVFSDFMYRFYGDALAKKLEADGCDVWMYSFDYREACHGMGYGYLTGNIRYAPDATEEEKQEYIAVSDNMREKIWSCIRDGQPDPEVWPKYRGGTKMVFDKVSRAEYRPDDTLEGFPAEVYR